jgi:hypothetical protein
MKKIVIILICGILLAPLAAWGQNWIAPYTDKDGTYVEGHWQTPEDLRKDKYTTPGQVNPYTGQFNPYSPGVKPQPNNPAPGPPFPENPNPYYPRQDYRYRGY